MDIKNITQEAALAMKENNFDGALRMLKESLGMSRRNLAAMGAGDTPQDSEEISTGAMPCISALSDADLSHVEEASVNNDFVLFDNLFLPCNQDTPARQSMASLFNLGLCYHLSALRNPVGDARALLLRASYLYNLGINTTGQLVQEDANPDPFVVILCLSFLNNSGHIASHLLEHEESRWHSETVPQTIVTFLLRRRGVVDPVSFRLESILPGSSRPGSALSFFCPLRFYMEQPPNPAPAA